MTFLVSWRTQPESPETTGLVAVATNEQVGTSSLVARVEWSLPEPLAWPNHRR